MGERKGIGKKTRFEVFKRDKFTCQYCGRMAPDVILEVDHIKPVAEGGTNKMINLITSCRDCNRGKGKVRLSDDTEIKKQQEQLAELAEKREQLKMLMEWRTELSSFQQEELDYICEYWAAANGSYSLTEHGKATAMSYLKQFSLQEILDGIDIALAQYYRGKYAKTDDAKSIENAWKKVGGICYNRRKQKEAEDGRMVQDQ